MYKNLSNHQTLSTLHIGSALLLAVLVVTSSFAYTAQTTRDQNRSPPNMPSNPFPENGSINVSLTAQLNWTGGDPDNDTVTFNVFFGTNQTPPQVATNISNATYDPGKLSLSTTYYWRIIAWDNHSNMTSGPLWMFTTRSNRPPHTPHDPSPDNKSVDVPLSPTLTWGGGDPDNDTVKYDVYFGNTTSPPLKVHNASFASYTPGLLVATTHYYWKIVAWDAFNASSKGPMWNFITTGVEHITVNITQPLPDTLYINDQPSGTLSGRTIVYGKITIKAQANSGEGIKEMVLYIDGKKIQTYNNVTSFSYLWNPVIQFHGLSLKHNITVVATDNDNETAAKHINVTKWRFHILVGLLLAAGVVSVLIPHTTMKGLVLNLRQTGPRSYTFFALRMHFHTSSLLKNVRGVVKWKRCVVHLVIPPTVIVRLGPPRTLAYLSLTFLGSNMNTVINTGGFFQNRPIRQERGTIRQSMLSSLTKSIKQET